MDKIILKNYEVLACHGVNPEEKVEKQRFIVTVTLETDFSAAAKDDDLSKTVSYSAVRKDVDAFVKNNCFDLIETLSVRLSELLLKKYDLALSCEVSVKKPDAKMNGMFDYPEVVAFRRWHEVYLALGSSEGDRSGYLDFAISSFKADDNFKGVKESGRIETEPYGNVAKNMFLNSAVKAYTLYSPHELLSCTGNIEQGAQRRRDVHWGDRTLDIDILFYDDEVIGDDDLCVPHSEMQRREFVLKPLAELAPNKLHPVLKERVKDLLLKVQIGS